MLDAPALVTWVVNAMLTRQCVIFVIVMTRRTPNLQDPVEPLLAWFSASAHNHGQGITDMIEGLASVDWGLPDFRRHAARRLVRMWERGGIAAFRDLSASLPNKPATCI